MRRLLLVVTLLAVVAGCGSQSPSGPDAPVTVTSLTITGDERFTDLNQIHRLTATANAATARPSDVTDRANWQSSDPSVVAVTPAGDAASIGLGTATITASYQQRAASLDVLVVLADAPARMVGRYRLAFTPSCIMPEWARHREYGVALVQAVDGSLVMTVELESGQTKQFEVGVVDMWLTIDFPKSGPAYGTYGPRFPVFSHVDGAYFFQVLGTASGRLHHSRVSGELRGSITATNLTTNISNTCGGDFTLVRQ